MDIGVEGGVRLVWLGRVCNLNNNNNRGMAVMAAIPRIRRCIDRRARLTFQGRGGTIMDNNNAVRILLTVQANDAAVEVTNITMRVGGRRIKAITNIIILRNEA